jgi:signal transduction histidine kinase/ActR/RegA family two-component response regulator
LLGGFARIAFTVVPSVSSQPQSASDSLFAHDGESAALMRTIDWARTSLGPVESWPASVRALVPVMLASRFAMRIIWGPDHTMLYNDGYRPILGARKHPSAMGHRASESFAEVWDVVGPLFGRVYAGEAVGLEDLPLSLDRNGYREECYFTLSYSPILDDSGAVGGVLGVIHETTERVLAERRLRTLRELAGSTARATTPDEACRLGGEALAKNSADAPFALFYLLEEPGRARLSWQVGVDQRPDVAAPVVAVTADRVGAWPLAGDGAGCSVVREVAERFGAIAAGPFIEPVREAVVLRLDRPGFGAFGFLVVGVNPRRALDDVYRAFYELACEHVVAALANGSARRQAEQARVRLYSQFMQAPVAVSVVFGHELVYDLANPLYEEMVGRKGLVGRSMRDVFVELPADAPIFAMLREIHRTGQPFRAEEFPLAIDVGGGRVERRIFKLTCQPMRDGGGAIFGIMTVALDVTQQVQARLDLSAARSLLEEVVAQMPSGVLIADAATRRIVVVNEQLRRLLGEGAVGEGAAEAARLVAFCADGRPLAPAEHPLLRALAGESLFDEELTIAAADGTRRVVSASAAPIRDALGAIVAAAATFADVSDRKRQEEQRHQLLARERQARAEAEVANRSKDEFLAMLGHELRNPLAPILTALQLLRLRHPDAGARERGIIERQVDHVRRLVEDLLDVARIRQGRITLRKERVELYDAVAKAMEMASPLVEAKAHALRLDVPHKGLLVDADPTRLAQVAYNLIANAAKYTEPRGQIAVSAERQDGHVVLRVRDNGMGLSPDVKPRLFESFVQEQQALDRAQGGLGLGLSIVRSLVALHGGEVWARSDGPAQGSEFVVKLPVADLRAPAPTPPRPVPLADPAAAIATRRILIVDDNVDAAELLQDVLAAFGHEVTIAHDGPTALELAADFRPQLALLDIGLPVMDGYELARQLRRMPGLQALNLIAVTGYGQEADRRRADAAGFDRHLVKPVRVEELQHVIDEVFCASATG